MNSSTEEFAKNAGIIFVFTYPIVTITLYAWAEITKSHFKTKDEVRELPPLNAWQAAVYSGNRGTLATTVGAELMQHGIIDTNGKVISKLRPKQLSYGAKLMLDHAMEKADRETGQYYVPTADDFARLRAVREHISKTVVKLQKSGYYIRETPRLATAPVKFVWTIYAVGSLAMWPVMLLMYLGGGCFYLVMAMIGLWLMTKTLDPTWRRSEAGRAAVQQLIDEHRGRRETTPSPMLVPLFGAGALVAAVPAVAVWCETFNPAYLSQVGLGNITTSTWASINDGTTTTADGCSLFGSDSIGDSGCSSCGDSGGCSGCSGCSGCGGCGGD